METSSRMLRRRINVSTSVKGVKTFDCTVEGEGYTLQALLEESDNLVSSLDMRYPAAPPEEKPKKGEA